MACWRQAAGRVAGAPSWPPTFRRIARGAGADNNVIKHTGSTDVKATRCHHPSIALASRTGTNRAAIYQNDWADRNAD